MNQIYRITEGQPRGAWMDAGAWLHSLRECLEITPAELAEQAGLPSAAWLQDAEAGRRPVPSSFFKALAREYRISVDVFAAECLRYYDRPAYDALFGAPAELKAAA